MRPISEEERALIGEQLSLNSSSPTGLVRAKGGEVAGGLLIGRGEYKSWRVRVGGRKYYAHRLVWLLAHGFDCLDVGLEVDHIDRDATNNSLNNLRLGDRTRQTLNRSRKKGCRSKLRFVGWNQERGKWAAKYTRHWGDKGRTWVGYYESEEEAYYAALTSRLENHWIS